MTTITIIPEDSKLKPLEVRKDWNKIGDANAKLIKARRLAQDFGKPMPTGEIQDNPVPWVKVGAIYLSLFETGNTSWKPIVESLSAKKKEPLHDFNRQAWQQYALHERRPIHRGKGR